VLGEGWRVEEYENGAFLDRSYCETVWINTLLENILGEDFVPMGSIPKQCNIFRFSWLDSILRLNMRKEHRYRNNIRNQSLK
jgi:hypothetical protein